MHANLIHNRFQALSELGSGGFGKVLKCRDMVTNALVAIKIPLNEVGNELSRKEGLILERVRHIDGVVPFLGVSRDPISYDGDILVFQLCGHSLMGFVKKLDIVKVCKIGMQLVKTLKMVHAKGIVHRDIKPDNILELSPGSENVCLADFGLGEEIGQCREGEYAGTLFFMSERIHRGCAASPRDDLESLVFSLICLLAGELDYFYKLYKYQCIKGENKDSRNIVHKYNNKMADLKGFGNIPFICKNVPSPFAHMLVSIKLNQENLHDYLSDQFELMLAKAMGLPPRNALPDNSPVWPSYTKQLHPKYSMKVGGNLQLPLRPQIALWDRGCEPVYPKFALARAQDGFQRDVDANSQNDSMALRVDLRFLDEDDPLPAYPPQHRGTLLPYPPGLFFPCPEVDANATDNVPLMPRRSPIAPPQQLDQFNDMRRSGRQNEDRPANPLGRNSCTVNLRAAVQIQNAVAQIENLLNSCSVVGSERSISGHSSDPLSAVDKETAENMNASRKTIPKAAELVPRIVANRYKVVKVLGEGGCGVVYAGTDMETGVDVAIKFDHDNDNRMLQNEVEKYQLLCGCVGIPDLLAYGLDVEQPFIVLPQLTRTLADKMKALYYSFGIIPMSIVLKDFCKTIEIAKSMHSKKINHQDLKPQNIMEDENGNIHFVDFSAAPFAYEEKVSVTTPEYMSLRLHEGLVQNAVDDLQSLFFTFIEYSRGPVKRLPWFNNRENGIEHIEYLKRDRLPKILGKVNMIHLHNITRMIISLKPHKPVDYDALIHYLEKAVKEVLYTELVLGYSEMHLEELFRDVSETNHMDSNKQESNFDRTPDKELSCQLSEPVSDSMAPTCGTLTKQTTPVTTNSPLSIAMIDEADEGLEPNSVHTLPHRLSSRLASFHSISQSDFGVESIDEDKNNSEVCRPGTPTSYPGLAFMFSNGIRNAETQDCRQEKAVPAILLGAVERCELPDFSGQNLSQEPYPSVLLDNESKRQCRVPSPNKNINERKLKRTNLNEENSAISKYTSFTQDATQFAFMSTPFKVARPVDICRDEGNGFIRHQTINSNDGIRGRKIKAYSKRLKSRRTRLRTRKFSAAPIQSRLPLRNYTKIPPIVAFDDSMHTETTIRLKADSPDLGLLPTFKNDEVKDTAISIDTVAETCKCVTTNERDSCFERTVFLKTLTKFIDATIASCPKGHIKSHLVALLTSCVEYAQRITCFLPKLQFKRKRCGGTCLRYKAREGELTCASLVGRIYEAIADRVQMDNMKVLGRIIRGWI